MDHSRDQRDCWGLGCWRFDQVERHANHSFTIKLLWTGHLGFWGEGHYLSPTAQGVSKPWKQMTLQLLLFHTTSGCCHTSSFYWPGKTTLIAKHPALNCMYCCTTCRRAGSQTASPKEHKQKPLTRYSAQCKRLKNTPPLSDLPRYSLKKHNENPDFHYKAKTDGSEKQGTPALLWG